MADDADTQDEQDKTPAPVPAGQGVSSEEPAEGGEGTPAPTKDSPGE